MKIIIAEGIGFCTGVKRALEIARSALEKDRKPVYFLGEIIHNETISKEIKDKKGAIISDPEKIKSGTIVIRAHGAPPLPFFKNILMRNATCPLVKKAQEAAKTLFKAGYRVIIIGEKEHPEVKGIQGHIKNKAIVIEDDSETKKIKDGEKIGVVAQTTQNLERVNKILDILKKKTKGLKFINTLCPQVLSRQKEISKLLLKTNGILVIGSPTSANTNQLIRIARNAKKPVWLVNSVKNLKNKNFKKISVLGVISGTSAPDWEIKKIIKYLRGLC